MASWGNVLGLLHDKGKESDAFQQHIRKESGYEPDCQVMGDSHHAYVGGIIARRIYGKSFDSFLANQIASHHTGLHDYDEIEGILCKEIPKEIDTDVEKKGLSKPPFTPKPNDFHHLARMLFSCLVDADYLDTEAFMDKESCRLRQCKADLKTLLPRLEELLMGFKTQTDASEINIIRNQVQEQCAKKSDSSTW